MNNNLERKIDELHDNIENKVDKLLKSNNQQKKKISRRKIRTPEGALYIESIFIKKRLTAILNIGQ